MIQGGKGEEQGRRSLAAPTAMCASTAKGIKGNPIACSQVVEIDASMGGGADKVDFSGVGGSSARPSSRASATAPGSRPCWATATTATSPAPRPSTSPSARRARPLRGRRRPRHPLRRQRRRRPQRWRRPRQPPRQRRQRPRLGQRRRGHPQRQRGWRPADRRRRGRHPRRRHGQRPPARRGGPRSALRRRRPGPPQRRRRQGHRGSGPEEVALRATDAAGPEEPAAPLVAPYSPFTGSASGHPRRRRPCSCRGCGLR